MIKLEIAVSAPVKNTYTYSAEPEGTDLSIDASYAGRRVLVPFGRRPATGYVLGESNAEEGDFEIKPILKFVDESPLFHSDQIAFFRWVAHYYHYPLGLVIKAALPGGLSLSPQRIIRLVSRSHQQDHGDLTVNPEKNPWLNKLLTEGQLGYKESKELLSSKKFKADINALVDAGIVIIENILSNDRVRAKRELCYRLEDHLWPLFEEKSEPEQLAAKWAARVGRSLTAAEIKSLRILWEMQQARPGEAVPRKELAARYSYGERLLSRLAEEGLIARSRVRVFRSPFGDLLPHYPKPEKLSSEQVSAVDTIVRSIELQSYQPFLLHGVTGSGKTEVYLQAAEKAIALGKSVLVLVPEIALATQIEAHFISRFKTTVALLHSGLTQGERFDEWWRILKGEARIVIGARSAVFAPLTDIGLVIVDEEHDSSYKQEDGLRYNGRDLAIVRAQLADTAVILGSATPSVVSYSHSLTSKYQLLRMGRRIGNRELPEPLLVDLKKTPRTKGVNLFHPELQKGLETGFAHGQQSILLLNRRGYSTSVICRDCGTIVECIHCKVTLNQHRQKNKLLCHYCGFSLSGSVPCSVCGSVNLHPVGIGTERVEEEVAKLLPEARVARLDSDVASDRKKFVNILQSMHNREIDVLVGTQIVAKGLHFPHVTLVGVVMADSGLGFPDFRAAEKTYQLITQVTGRAGRGDTRGKVIIQTLQPDHYAISLAADKRYEELVETELAIRKRVGFPPYCRLVCIIVEDERESVARDSSMTIADMAGRWCRRNDGAQAVTLLGPAPAPLERIRDRYRWQILIKSMELGLLHGLIEWLSDAYKAKGQTRVHIDIDPENMW